MPTFPVDEKTALVRNRRRVNPHEVFIADVIDRGPGRLLEERCECAAPGGGCGSVDGDQVDPQPGQRGHAQTLRQGMERFHRLSESVR